MHEGSDMITVSTVIPAYNREKTIGRCIKSVLEQSVKPIEIIVVDDGSNDRTAEIVNEYAASSTIPIILVRQKNKGAQAARNRGIECAKGEYIAFLDSDDEWLPNKIEIQAGFLKDKETVVYSDCYVENDLDDANIDKYADRGKLYTRKGRIIWKARGGDGFVYDKMLKFGGPMFQGIITSKKALENIGLLDENVKAYQEWETSIRLSKSNKFIHIHEPLFIYHIHDGETISKNAEKDVNGLMYIVDKHRRDIRRICGKEELSRKYLEIVKKCIKYENNKYLLAYLKWLFSCI